ncbi:F-box protein [Quillaja saponaria]|uniref:F-box protein n=1 Tax=Quillaja saponaria TaxID=32244 RepID=A0AAD7KWU3_QUISA|nr:F-box protein [Quillaja saponaria]
MEVHVAAPSNKTSLALVNSNDLVVDILSRLPVKSLMRFKCVHKSWHVLIDEDNYFKTMHLHKFTFNENNARILLKQQIENPSKDVLHMLSDEEAHESVARLDMPSIFQIEEFPYGINHPYLCSVNGIICISNCKRAGLWNPAIREFRLLPDFQQPDVKDYNYNGYGIGYDCIRDDYKVIRTVDCYTENGYYLEDEESTYTPGSPMFFQPPEKLFFEVYSLKTDSWRKVNVDSEPFIIASYTLPNHVYLKGACHWLSCQTNDHDGVLLSFDMIEEVFQKTDLPDRVRSDGPIVNLKGSIAFINEDFRESKCFYIWILEGGQLYVTHSIWLKAESDFNQQQQILLLIQFTYDLWFYSNLCLYGLNNISVAVNRFLLTSSCWNNLVL